MNAWAGVIGGAHAMIAMMRQEPHWALTDADAKAYGAALKNAARHFSIGATQKALDIGALMMMAFMMESPRVRLSWTKSRERRRPQGNAAPGGGATVYHLHPNNPQQPPAAPAAAPVAPAQPSGGVASGGVEGFTGDGIDRGEMGPI